MCYCNCPHEDINGCCREDECTFVKNGMTPPKVVKEMLKDGTVSKG